MGKPESQRPWQTSWSKKDKGRGLTEGKGWVDYLPDSESLRSSNEQDALRNFEVLSEAKAQVHIAKKQCLSWIWKSRQEPETGALAFMLRSFLAIILWISKETKRFKWTWMIHKELLLQPHLGPAHLPQINLQFGICLPTPFSLFLENLLNCTFYPHTANIPLLCRPQETHAVQAKLFRTGCFPSKTAKGRAQAPNKLGSSCIIQGAIKMRLTTHRAN